MSALLKGIAASPGLAKGRTLRWEPPSREIPRYVPQDLNAEKQRLAGARRSATAQLRHLAGQVSSRASALEAAVFEAQIMFLDDPALVDKAEAEIDSALNAEAAWHAATDHFARSLESLSDETLRARSADVRDVGRRVVAILCGDQTPPAPEKPAVLIARDLAPSETASLMRSPVLAICTAEGGPTSHTAILAKAMGIPAVVALGPDLLNLRDDDLVLVDGTAGTVLAAPDSSAEGAFDDRVNSEGRSRSAQLERAQEPAHTSDGHPVEVVANIGRVEDAPVALHYGAEGVGLLRTEFLFLNRTEPPDEETQFAAYAAILGQMGTRPVVVRTLDVGGDKAVPYYDFGPEANPFLGYRAIRISLDRPEDFKIQLRALWRAGAGHRLRVMFPMIATLGEVTLAKELLREARTEVAQRGQAAAGNLEVGIMVEIPSVALLADRFAPEVDFFSVGTNDLAQYVLAAERGNKRLIRLNDPCHPAVLRAIERICDAAHRLGKWVGVCGEMAGDPDAIPLLIGLGVDELSMAPSLIPPAKEAIRRWSLTAARALAQRALGLDEAEAVRRAVAEAGEKP